MIDRTTAASLQSLAALLASPEPRAAGLSEATVRLAAAAGVMDLVIARLGKLHTLAGHHRAFVDSSALGALRLHEFGRISVHLRESGVPVAPLKGMAYSLILDGGAPTRAMSDVDLLVPPACFAKAIETMRKLGYRDYFPEPISRAADHAERAFVGTCGLVEIHRAFLSGERITVDYEALWSRATPLEAHGVACWRLSPEDTLAYHCFHMGLHEFQQGLRPVVELCRLIREDRPSLPVAATRAREWGTQRINWCAYRLLTECLPGALGEADHALFALSPLWRMLLEVMIVRPSIRLLLHPRGLPRATQLYRKLLLMERYRGAARYAWWHLRHSRYPTR